MWKWPFLKPYFHTSALVHRWKVCGGFFHIGDSVALTLKTSATFKLFSFIVSPKLSACCFVFQPLGTTCSACPVTGIITPHPHTQELLLRPDPWVSFSETATWHDQDNLCCGWVYFYPHCIFDFLVETNLLQMNPREPCSFTFNLWSVLEMQSLWDFGNIWSQGNVSFVKMQLKWTLMLKSLITNNHCSDSRSDFMSRSIFFSALWKPGIKMGFCWNRKLCLLGKVMQTGCELQT